MTGESTLCTLLSSTKISLALAQRDLTSHSLMISHRLNCSICRSKSELEPPDPPPPGVPPEEPPDRLDVEPKVPPDRLLLLLLLPPEGLPEEAEALEPPRPESEEPPLGEEEGEEVDEDDESEADIPKLWANQKLPKLWANQKLPRKFLLFLWPLRKNLN